MAKEHMFVLCYDEVEKRWYHDVDTEEAHFGNGTIYNRETDEWTDGYIGDGKYEPMSEQCLTKLSSALTFLNK